MKTVNVKIRGVSPLLLNKFKDQDEIPAKVTKGKKDYGTPREQAEKTAYADEATGRLWVPWSWISGCIRSVASDYKINGSRKSVKSVSSGAVRLTDERLFFDEAFTIADIEVDSRPAVVQRARIMRHRARLENWTLSFAVEVEEDILPLDQVHEILNDAGKRAGLGDYRVEKGGPFGRFQVVAWSVMSEGQDAKVEKFEPKRKRA